MTVPAAIDRTFARSRKRLDARDLAWQRALAEEYANAIEDIVAAQRQLADWVKKQEAKGGFSPSWLTREQRYLNLQSRLYRAIHEFGVTAADLLDPATRRAVEEALQTTKDEVTAAAGGIQIAVPTFGPSTWALLNEEALRAAIALVADEMSPLRLLLERDLPETAVAVFRSEWTSGVARGINPNTIARRISNKVTNLSLGRAQLIARTELHRAYRAGKVEQFSGLDTVTGWTWRAALDGRTCSICYAMHGTVHPKTEMLASHPACRCTMVPRTADWGELGFGGNLQDTRPVFETGESLFAKLPADKQLKMLGPTRYKAYQRGVPLESMVGIRQHPIWGTSRVLEPVRNLPA